MVVKDWAWLLGFGHGHWGSCPIERQVNQFQRVPGSTHHWGALGAWTPLR